MLKKSRAKEALLILFGNLILAVGTVCFILPNNILSGGLAGVAIAVQPLIPLSAVNIINILAVSLWVLSFFTLGKSFALRTLLSTVLYPVLVNILDVFVTPNVALFEVEPTLASLYGGLLTGFGLGLVFRTGASTGGMDIPALILHKYAHLPESQAVGIVDGLTVLLGIYTYGLQAALIGLLSVFTSAVAIRQTLLLGSEARKKVMIISEKWEEIRAFLLSDKVSRGVTILEGRGGYTNKERPVLMVIITQRQLVVVERETLTIDPKAFLIVTEANEVHGAGFTFEDGSL